MTETETQHICLYGGRYVKLKGLNWCDAEINSKLKLLISKEEQSSWPTEKAQRHATMICQTTEHRSDTDIAEKPSLNFTRTKKLKF